MTLVAALLCTVMLLALGSALTLTSAVESQAAAWADLGREAFHAAEAAAERALADLETIADWSLALDGTVRSSFVDGAGAGARTLASFSVDLDALTAELNGWRSDDGAWRLFAHAPLTQLLADGSVASRMYGIVWITTDAARPGAIVLMSHAYGPAGVRRMVELTAGRTSQQKLRLLVWREHRQ